MADLFLPLTFIEGQLQMCGAANRIQRCTACNPEVHVITKCEGIEVDLTGLWQYVPGNESCEECPGWATEYEIPRKPSGIGTFLNCVWEDTFTTNGCNNNAGELDPTTNLFLNATITLVQNGADCEVWLCVTIGLGVGSPTTDRHRYVKHLGTLNGTNCTLDLRGTSHELEDNGVFPRVFDGCGESRQLACLRTGGEVAPFPPITVNFP